MSSKYSTKQYINAQYCDKRAKFGAKIFRHFWDIVIFMLQYFILSRSIYVPDLWHTIWLLLLRLKGKDNLQEVASVHMAQRPE